jgi:hypothetical protein
MISGVTGWLRAGFDLPQPRNDHRLLSGMLLRRHPVTRHVLAPLAAVDLDPATGGRG